MRLLNTTSLTLHEFFGNSIPSYAILSHRWEDEEVTFQDLQAGFVLLTSFLSTADWFRIHQTLILGLNSSFFLTDLPFPELL